MFKSDKLVSGVVDGVSNATFMRLVVGAVALTLLLKFAWVVRQ
jgi:hypothetical protein